MAMVDLNASETDYERPMKITFLFFFFGHDTICFSLILYIM